MSQLEPYNYTRQKELERIGQLRTPKTCTLIQKEKYGETFKRTLYVRRGYKLIRGQTFQFCDGNHSEVTLLLLSNN
jgi:hypothetical protein